jgi:hypothetical protein
MSPVVVMMFCAPGRMREVPLWVSTSVAAKQSTLTTPAAAVPRAVIVVVPVMFTNTPVAAPMSVVAALAMSLAMVLMASWVATPRAGGMPSGFTAPSLRP